MYSIHFTKTIPGLTRLADFGKCNVELMTAAIYFAYDPLIPAVTWVALKVAIAARLGIKRISGVMHCTGQLAVDLVSFDLTTRAPAGLMSTGSWADVYWVDMPSDDIRPFVWRACSIPIAGCWPITACTATCQSASTRCAPHAM